MRSDIGVIMYLILCANLLTKTDFPLLHYSVSMAAAAAAAAVAHIPLSAAAAVVAYIPLSAADTHHCSVDTHELFHAYFFYVST